MRICVRALGSSGVGEGGREKGREETGAVGEEREGLSNIKPSSATVKLGLCSAMC